MNRFVKEATMGVGSSMTENGAFSYASFGTEIMNQFGKAGTYRGRLMDEVWADQSSLWAENPETALRFPFYLRMITRKDKMMDNTETTLVQKGQGVRDEAFKRLLWIAEFHPEVFYNNLWLLPIVGSWKDLWVLLTMGEGVVKLDKEKFFSVMAMGINSPSHLDLVKKYLPRIRSNSKCVTPWAKATNNLAKEFAAFAGWSPKEYRQFKSTGKAHEFQRVICGGLYDRLNFNAIPGKALLSLVSGKFLSKHGLEKRYLEWLLKQPVAKFNGYPFELYRKLKNVQQTRILTTTVDKQFDNLIKTAKENNGAIKGNVWCALDTSGSMGWYDVDGNGTTPLDICISLGVYFSTLNEGAFHKNVIMFDNKSKVKQLHGTFTEMVNSLRYTNAMGGTNFQSVVNEIVRIRKTRPEIPLEDFPTTLLVVSDMQFNCTGTLESNYEMSVRKLQEVFPEEWVKDFKFVWWYVRPGGTPDFPSNMDCGGTYMISGYDGSIASMLLGGEGVVDKVTGEKRTPTMEELIDMALNQEVLGHLSL